MATAIIQPRRIIYIEPPSGTRIYKEALAQNSIHFEAFPGLTTFYTGDGVGITQSISGSVAIYRPDRVVAIIANQSPTAEQLNSIGEKTNALIINDIERSQAARTRRGIERFATRTRPFLRTDGKTDHTASVMQKLLADLGTYIDQLEVAASELNDDLAKLVLELHELEVVEVDHKASRGAWWPIREMASELRV